LDTIRYSIPDIGGIYMIADVINPMNDEVLGVFAGLSLPDLGICWRITWNDGSGLLGGPTTQLPTVPGDPAVYVAVPSFEGLVAPWPTEPAVPSTNYVLPCRVIGSELTYRYGVDGREEFVRVKIRHEGSEKEDMFLDVAVEDAQFFLPGRRIDLTPTDPPT
jgi:hypothetical protein